MPHITSSIARRKKIPHESLQTIIIHKGIKLKDAINWLANNNYNFNDIRETHDSHRFLQTNPIVDATYYSKRVTPDITLVFQHYK